MSVCDIAQLAREQHYSTGITEVWVFSDSPLEFRTAGTTDRGFKDLRSTITENLRNAVKYVYFVGSNFHKDAVEYLVAGDPDREKMLDYIHVIKVPSHFFSMYFTLHFRGGRGPDAIYMSSVMEDRKDLLLQVSNSLQVQRIFERLSILKGEGELEHEGSPRITRFVLDR